MEYVVKEQFISEREITIDADCIEDARSKYRSGEWDGEDEYNFYSNSVIEDEFGLTK